MGVAPAPQTLRSLDPSIGTVPPKPPAAARKSRSPKESGGSTAPRGSGIGARVLVPASGPCALPGRGSEGRLIALPDGFPVRALVPRPQRVAGDNFSDEIIVWAAPSGGPELVLYWEHFAATQRGPSL